MPVPKDLTVLQRVVDITYRLLNLAPKLDYSPRKPRLTFLDTLPPEIWLDVASHLEPVDKACLAITTVSMLSILGNQYLSLDKKDKGHFLVRFDVDYPDYRLCFDCLIYYRRTDRERKHEFGCPRRLDIGNRYYNDEFARLGNSRIMRFQPVQLVMRADRYNAAYGITLQDFEHMCRNASIDPLDSETTGQPLLWDITFKAAICETGQGRHLLLRTQGVLFTQELEREGPGIVEPRELVGHRYNFIRGVPACKHLEMQISALIENAYHRFATTSRAARCIYCYTDYYIDLEPERFVVTTWTDFGDGKSPAGKEWSSVVQEGSRRWVYGPEMIPIEEADKLHLFEGATTTEDG